jgi:hypothetical protein
MAVGSHTHFHEPLPQLSPASHMAERATSRRPLEDRLTTPVEALAYPVGRPTSFNQHTYKALAGVGNRIAFSYGGGVNLRRRTRRYNVKRMSVDAALSRSLFRLCVVSAALTTRTLI